MSSYRRVVRGFAVASCLAGCGLLGAVGTAWAVSAPTIGEESVTNVGSSSATLQAQIDAEGAETTYRFEYGVSSSYGTVTPISGGAMGSGTSPVTVQAHPQELQPETIYHYRVVATSAAGTSDGPDETFVTQAPRSALELPDARRYEMVSPPGKYGAEVDSLHMLYESGEGGVIQAAEDGSAITYETNAPVVPNPPGSVLLTQIISSRGPGGWSSQDIATAHDHPSGFAVGIGQEYRLFSSDLSLAAVQPFGHTPLSPETPPGMTENDIYRREANGTYRSLIDKASNIGRSNLFVGASPNLDHIVFKSPAALTPEAHQGVNSYGMASNLYEWSSEGLKLVNVLPDGEPTPGPAELGAATSNGIVRGAVSDDGSRVIWSETGGGGLYSRDMVTGKTVQVDAALGGNGIFQIASADGSKIFFTHGDLYVFETNTSKLVDLSSGSVGVVQGVVGASEDGSYVYVVAGSLYVLHSTPSGWVVSAIAPVSGGLGGEELRDYYARVSPDGRYFAFMSETSLTGYDNRDANSGVPDVEVFLYDAASKRLVCVSCNPTGARPVGEYDGGRNNFHGLNEPLMEPYGGWQGAYMAAALPSWTMNGTEQVFYQPRFLTDSGRVFFGSADALVPNDSNGVEDVYEYEPPGVGTCSEHATTFSPAAMGCVNLISAGTGASASAFMDASASGNDVFVLTHDRLSSQDVDGAFDVYDARSCSGSRECLAAGLVSPPPCSTSDSCKPAPSQQPAIFGAPPSATFSGAGNVVASHPASSKRTGSHRVLKRKKSRKKRARGRRSARRNSNRSVPVAGRRRA
jgi:hypothetical protein